MKAWFPAVLVLLLALPARHARACTLPGDEPFTSFNQPNTTPPSIVSSGDPHVSLEQEPSSGCVEHPIVCNLGIISVAVSASDDVTPSSELGYRVRIISGPRAPGFTKHDLFDRRPTHGQITLIISSGAGGRVDYHFELGISAIDSAGNVGPETSVRVVYDNTDSGCRSGRDVRPFGALALALSTLVLVLRRRRCPSGQGPAIMCQAPQ
jgi:hypothetical protein